MVNRIAPVVCAALLIVAASAWAQSEIRGVVGHVDPVTRRVYFTDGRVVQLKPGSTLLINGQPVLLESLRPGATIVMMPPGSTTTTVTTVTQQTQVAPMPPPPPLPVSTPVNVTGTVARTDPLTQTITFQDGRVVKVAPNTMVWQQAPAISSILPGAQVFVRDAVPAGYLPSGSASAYPTGHHVMGTVSRVDPNSNQIVLTNGTVVYVSPTGTFRSGGQRVAITHLRPGDEILMQVRNPTPVAPPIPAPTNVTVHTTAVPSSADRYAGSALPYQGYADTRIEATDVQIMWSPQSR